MRVARGEKPRAAACAPGSQMHHRADALAGALGGVERARRAEEGGGVLLASMDDAVGLVERVRAADFRDVVRLRAEHGAAFMAGHVQADGLPLRIVSDKIDDGGIHITCLRPWQL